MFYVVKRFVNKKTCLLHLESFPRLHCRFKVW